MLVRATLAGPCSRADLADQLFAEAGDPRATLRWYLTHLRAQLPEPERQHLVTAERVAFTGPTDVRQFEREAARLIDHPDDAGAADVLALYRGDLCAGLTVTASADFDTWLYVEQERLRRVFRQATVAVARHALSAGVAGEAERVVGPLARLVTVDPYYEEGHRLLVDAHERAGRRDAALAAYRRDARLLRQECSGLILLDAVIGDGAFTGNAAALVSPWSATLGMRFGGFEEYVTRMREQHVRHTHYPYTDEAERILERTLRYELAPLPDGTYRRRALRAAFEGTWASLLQVDSLAALARVRCPTMIVHATRPWIDGRPYLTDEIIAAQRKVVPQAQLVVARRSNHPLLVRDPEPEMVEALRSFVRSLAAPPAQAG